MRFTPKGLAAFTGVVVAGAVTGLLVAALVVGRSDRIVQGVEVSGVNLGGLRMPAAAATLRNWSRQEAKTRIVLTALNTHWNGSYAALGARIDWKTAAQRAYRVGRGGSIVDRVVCCLLPGGPGKRFAAPLLISRPRLEKTIDKVASAIDRPHKDARLRVVGRVLQIQQDACGIKVNRELIRRCNRTGAAGRKAHSATARRGRQAQGRRI